MTDDRRDLCMTIVLVLCCFIALAALILILISTGCREVSPARCTGLEIVRLRQTVNDPQADAAARQRAWQRLRKCVGPAKPEIKEIN